MKEFYEPKFYEVRALAHVARTLGGPVVANYRLPRADLPFHERPEIDGYVEIDGNEWAIEVKSYPLDRADIDVIVRKYKDFGFDRIMIVAPHIGVSLPHLTVPCLELVPFVPDLSPIVNYYANWMLDDPWIREEMASGWHHFRYKLAERSPNRPRWMLNQVDKRIKTDNKLRYEILHRMVPRLIPIRVYWSINQWLSPKDLFFARRPNVLTRRHLVFDIDGDQIHHPFFPCVYNDQGMCEYCFQFAKQHSLRLLGLLDEKGLGQTKVLFSGWRGFHIYVPGARLSTKETAELVHTALASKIRVDTRVTLDSKGIIGMPGTMHGYSMKPLVVVRDLAAFSWEDVQRL